MSEGLETTDIERAFWAYDRASVSNNCVAAEVSGAVSEAVWGQALRMVAARHPALGYRISLDGSHWVADPSDPVDGQSLPPATSWVSVVEQELSRPFSASAGPQVRGRWLSGSAGRPSWLLVTLPHLITDGRCCFRFVRDVLAEADRLMSGAPEPVVPLVDWRRPATACFDPRRAQAPDWHSRLQTDGGPVYSTARPSGSFLPPEGPAAVGTGLVVLDLDQETSDHVTRGARTAEVSLNAWLTAAAVRVLGDLWPAFQVNSALDLRDLVLGGPLGSRELGMWAGRFSLFAKPGHSTTAELAREFQAGTLQILRRSAFYGLYQMTGRAEAPPPAPPLPSLKITNHGDLDADGFSSPLARLHLESLRGFTPLHRGWRGQGGLGLIPSIFGGRLQLTFAYPGALTRDQALQRARAVVETASCGASSGVIVR